MKVKVTVGEVEVSLSEVDLTPRQIAALINRCASIAVALGISASSEDEPETKHPLGFSAHMELDPERNSIDIDPEWFEEEAP